jgi:hypothetical protein
MSESTADSYRLSFGVGRNFEPPGLQEWGSLTPGCLTSEDEERETWTAESLRVSIVKASAFKDWDRTKDFGGTRFKGYTIVVSDVNRRR